MSPSDEEYLQLVAQHLLTRRRGLFIAFEGGDGSGKTTQTAVLTKKLAELGAPVLGTFEPGATPLGQKLRELVMHGPEDVDVRTEALLYAADRAYHAATMIRPALETGQTVFTDRYIDSSVAYQGIGRGLGESVVRDLSEWATDGLLPDFVFVFAVDPKIGLARIGRSFDRLERAGEDFHQAVSDYYHALAESDQRRYRVVEADGTEQETFTNLVRELACALGVAE